ncbi:hypothetical protein [Streptomyces sp. NPDC058739]|uniref:hypothetical protein n=1 Tax=Streptomyces sp. NPDC058739 TaxID=3346618 RepID=UPI003691AF33
MSTDDREQLAAREQLNWQRADVVARTLVQLATDPQGRAFLFGLLGVESQPSIMDATRTQLRGADLRAQHAVAAMDIVLRRWTWGDAETLGQLMPDLPEDVRETVADHLVKAGLS